MMRSRKWHDVISVQRERTKAPSVLGRWKVWEKVDDMRLEMAILADKVCGYSCHPSRRNTAKEYE